MFSEKNQLFFEKVKSTLKIENKIFEINILMNITDEFYISNGLNILQRQNSFNNTLMKTDYVNTESQNSSSSILSVQSQNSSTNDLFPNQQSNEDHNDQPSNEGNIQNTKRKLFTKEEDNLLTMAAFKFNQGSWNDIAKFVPGRTPKQCRDRWTNYLQPSLKFDPWKNSEDKNLISLVKSNGTHWKKMKRYFPGRSTNSLKNRWHWLMNNQEKLLLNKSMMKINNQKPTPAKCKKNIKKVNDKFNFPTVNNGNIYQFNGNNTIPIVNNQSFKYPNGKEIQNNYLCNINQNQNKTNLKQNGNINYLDANSGNNIETVKKNFIDKGKNGIFEENDLITINPEELDW